MNRIARNLALTFLAATVALGIASASAGAENADVAGAGDYTGGTTTIPRVPDDKPPADDSEVLNSTLSGSDTDAAVAAPSAPSDVEGSTLAFTGSDTTLLAAIGGAAVVFGLMALGARRRPGHA